MGTDVQSPRPEAGHTARRVPPPARTGPPTYTPRSPDTRGREDGTYSRLTPAHPATRGANGHRCTEPATRGRAHRQACTATRPNGPANVHTPPPGHPGPRGRYIFEPDAGP